MKKQELFSVEELSLMESLEVKGGASEMAASQLPDADVMLLLCKIHLNRGNNMLNEQFYIISTYI